MPARKKDPFALSGNDLINTPILPIGSPLGPLCLPGIRGAKRRIRGSKEQPKRRHRGSKEVEWVFFIAEINPFVAGSRRVFLYILTLGRFRYP